MYCRAVGDVFIYEYHYKGDDPRSVVTQYIPPRETGYSPSIYMYIHIMVQIFILSCVSRAILYAKIIDMNLELTTRELVALQCLSSL